MLGMSLHAANTKVPLEAQAPPRRGGLSARNLETVVREIALILNHQEIAAMRVRFAWERANGIHLSIAIFRGQIAADIRSCLLQASGGGKRKVNSKISMSVLQCGH